MGLRSVLLFAAFLAACAGTRGSMKIGSRTTSPTSINLSRGGDKTWVKVQTVGNDTVVDFRGREFVFKNLTGYKGTLSFEECDLDIGEAEVEITEDSVEVEHGERVARLGLEGLPDGSRIVYSAGSLRLE